MKISYGVTEEVYTLGGKRRISYGIAAYADSDLEQTKTIIISVRDISSVRSDVEKLVRSCRSQKLDIIHLGEVVEDFLAQM